MAQNQTGEKLELEIYAQAGGGAGLARAPDGRVVLVEGALAGERVLVQLNQMRKDYMQGRALHVLSASPHRVEPRCPLFGVCGGCDLMHISYDAQLEAKSAWLGHALNKLPGLPAPVMLGSPDQWNYRNRVRLQASAGRVGFFGKKSHKLIALEQCPVSDPGVNRILPELGAAIGGIKGPRPAWIELLSHRDQLFGTVGYKERTRISRSSQRAVYLRLTELGFNGMRFSMGNRLGAWPLQKENGLPYLEQEDLTLWAFPGLFCQVNFGLNQRLIETIVREAGPGGEKAALDLYCGSGNFSLPLARAGWRVLGVEGVGPARPAAEFMAQKNGLQNRLEFHTGSVAKGLEGLNEAGRGFDLVLLDPPRAGAKGLMPRIARCGPQKVIYVSCHPAALARDALALADLGYAASALYAADMFPHTGHVEAVLVMEKT